MFPKPLGNLSAIAGALCLVACTARPVTPISMTMPGDEQLSCAELNEHIKANMTAANELFAEDKDVAAGNVAKGVLLGGGLLAAALMDLSNEEQVKARSVNDRNERLTFLARSKGCSGL